MMDRWEYLITKEYMLRHEIAGYFLKDVDAVIDVGSYKKTLDWDNVHAIDPLKSMEDSYHGTISEWLQEPFYFELSNCGVMALGLEIEGSPQEWQSFINIVEECKIAIIEYSVEHEPSMRQASDILSSTKKDIKMEIGFKFPDLDIQGFKPHTNRKMIILERK